MADSDHDLEALSDLIELLGAATVGDRRLDVKIEYCLGVALAGRIDVANLMIEEGFSWDSVSAAVEGGVPPYTSSIDAAVRAENIVFVMKSARRGQWGAIHRDENGQEILMWAATEALARRRAAMVGWRAQLTEAAGGPLDARPVVRSQPAARSDGASNGNLEGDWKVLF